MLGARSLRCRLGWHRPLPGGVWNYGYCFTACERCGRDMVRSAFGEWYVPSGLRVIAHADAAAVRALDAALTERDARSLGTSVAPARPATAPTRSEPTPPPRPIEAVKRRPVSGSPFDFDDFTGIDPAAPATPAPGSPALPRNRAAT